MSAATPAPGPAPAAPWKLFVGGTYWGRYRTRRAAVGAVERPFVGGIVQVRHERTGERWERRGGSWFKSAEGTHGKAKTG